MKTLWIANGASCQEPRNQNTTLLGGSGWKKGRCEMRFMLSCFCVYTGCKVPILHPQRLWQRCLAERYDLNHSLCLKLASVTLGVTAGKNLSDSAWSHLSHYLFPLSLKSFVFEFVTQIIFFPWTKPQENHHPVWQQNKSIYFFFPFVYHTINRKGCISSCWIVRTVSGHFKYNMFSYRV